MRACKVFEKRVRGHLVQGHAQGTQEASIIVLKSNGGGRPARKEGMRTPLDHT